MTQGPVVQSKIKLILVQRKLIHLFTAKGGFATKLWSDNVKNYKLIFLKH